MQIIRYPHPTLRYKCKPLRRVDGELRKMIRQMFDLMYEEDGVGLAASQVDLPYRLFVTNTRGDAGDREGELVFINPVIVRQKGMAEVREGCLSLPEIYAPVKRPEKAVVSAYNEAGQEVTYELEGLDARAAQHEYDHLEGVLFIDRLSTTNLLAIREALAELEDDFLGQRRMGVIPDDEQIIARLAELEEVRA